MTAMFWPVVIFMAISLAIGLYTYTQVRGSSKRYTVCNKSMPFIVIGTALAAQAIDGNATLGNVSLTSTQGFWSGIAIPIGLAASLFIVGRFLAEPLNRMGLLTLPEFFYRRYGKGAELAASVLTIVCFIVLVAGNLSAVAWILTVATGLDYGTALAIGTAVILAYTVAGGLYAAIWTDFFQIHIAIIGFVGAAIWLIVYKGWDATAGATLARAADLAPLTQIGSGSLMNWSYMISLAVGNAMALDFMERVFSAKSPRTARNGCYYAGTWTLIIGGCASLIGVAAQTMVAKTSDPRMLLPAMAAEVLPFWIGMLVFLGVLGASMSTANGAMLVIAVVGARNVWQRWTPRRIEDSTMLLLSRVLALPVAIAAGVIAYWRPDPGILLVIAFDIVFAGCVVPLFFGVYWPKANSAGALAAIATGTLARLVCHLTVPPALAGLDTLLPPVISLVAFVTVCYATQGATEPGKHAAMFDEPELSPFSES